jgi:hypothetical protein
MHDNIQLSSLPPVIHSLLQEHPYADTEHLVSVLCDRLRRDEDLLEALARYAIRQLELPQITMQRERAPALSRKMIQKAAKLAANHILLLNLPMPNGLRLRFCTGTYIAKLGGKLTLVGKRAGVKLVGDVFDEDSLRKLLG